MARQYVWLFQNHLPINLWRPSRHVSRIYTSWLGSTVRWLLLHGHLQVRLWNFFGERFQIFSHRVLIPDRSGSQERTRLWWREWRERDLFSTPPTHLVCSSYSPYFAIISWARINSPLYRQCKYKSGQLVLQRQSSLWRSQLHWLQRRRYNPQVSPDDQCWYISKSVFYVWDIIQEFCKSLMGFPTNSPQDLCLSAPLPWRGPLVRRTVHQREYEAWSRKVWKNKKNALEMLNVQMHWLQALV